jgi:hypothetical protein
MEREQETERPADRVEPEDAKPGDDMPSDRDLNPASDTDRVVEEKGREREEEG